MKNYLKPLLLHSCAAALLMGLSLEATSSMAHLYTVGDIEVVHPYAPPTPPGVAMAAGYMEIINRGEEDDRLIGGSVYFAHEVQIHQTVVEDDVSRMRQLKDGLVIPAGATVKIEPMGIHIMFADLAEPLVEGGTQSATLIFEKAGELKVEFVIEHPNSGSMDGMHEDGMHMEGMHDEGMHEEGMHEEGMHMEGMHEEGMHMEGMHEEGMHMEGMHEEGMEMEGKHD